MDFIRDLPEQIASIWRQMETSSRVALVGLTLSILAAVAVVGYWSSRPDYVALATGLQTADVKELVSRLDQQNIAYQLTSFGSTVLVAKTDLNQAQMATSDVNGLASDGGESWRGGMLSDPESSRFDRLRHREHSLATTIERMAGVHSAKVHLAMASPSPFIQDKEPTKASAILELKPGVVFTREQAAAVVDLIAHGVEGLAPENVSVMDARGHILSSQSRFATSDVTHQLEYVRRVESELASKANTMLARLLGENRAIVRVTADVDFTRLQREETSFDPNLKVRTQETIESFSKTSPNVQVGGPAGTASNLESRSLGIRDPFQETEEKNVTHYENARIVDKLTQAPGKINRLTVAVLADLSPLERDDAQAAEAATPSTPTKVTQSQVEAIVKQAVGFDAARGDAIEVLVTEFAPTQPNESLLPVANHWEFYNQLIRNASLGLASLVALVLGMLTLRRMRPISIRIDDAEAEGPSPDELLSSLSNRIQQNPDAMRSIISAWLNEREQPEVEPTATTQRAA